MKQPNSAATLAPRREPRIAPKPSPWERLEYLIPTRYFRFYMFYDRASQRTCWLPEGFDI